MVDLWRINSSTMQKRLIKITTQLTTTILVFYALWFGLRQIDWMKQFKLKQTIETTEEKLGKLYWDIIKTTEIELYNVHITNPIDSITQHLCSANNIDTSGIKLHILIKDDINAFALPDNHLVIFTGLITHCESPDELAGVIAHEIAHMQKKHIMQKLTREIGLSALLSMTTGKSSGEMIKQTSKLLTSTAYDRNMEREADLTAVEYLNNANISAKPFANLLFRLATAQNMPNMLEWISTHPDSEERALTIIEKTNESDDLISNQIITPARWNEIKNQIQNHENYDYGNN